MNALLRRFVELIEADLAAAGFVRRGPVFRYFDADGHGIVLDLQRTTAFQGQAEFFINVGVLLAPHLKLYFGDTDPRLDVMPAHGVWTHRLIATDDHRFVLSTDADVDRCAAVVRAWLAANLPRMLSRLGDYDAMLAAADENHDGHWSRQILRVFAYADRGDIDKVNTETEIWRTDGADELAAVALDFAHQRRTERQG